MKAIVNRISNAVNPLRKSVAPAEFAEQFGVVLPVKARPESTEKCYRCKGTGTRLYISKAADSSGQLKDGTCFNCHGAGYLTPDQAVEVRANAKAGKRTVPAKGQMDLTFAPSASVDAFNGPKIVDEVQF